MSTQPMTDATKHELYRPHMGDMTGWRFLDRDTDVVQKGDECISTITTPYKCHWGEFFERDIGKRVREADDGGVFLYRRRISTELDSPKPVIAAEKSTVSQACGGRDGKCSAGSVDRPKRFMTVVYEATPENIAHIETLKAFGVSAQIREGNAIEALDGIEERALSNLRAAFKGEGV